MSNGELRLDAIFEAIPTLEVSITNTANVNADFGVVYKVENSHILCATTATWNSSPKFIGQKGYLYVYTDWMQDEHGNDIPGFKVGNGITYLIDLIFSDQKWKDHVEDFTIHITQAEREFWNNKVTCYPSEVVDEQLIFSKE